MPVFRPANPTGPYVVKGITPEQGGTPGVRLELRELRKKTDLWNLYLVGLWQFQLVPMDDQLSYFQIAGIHGRPYQAWPLNNKKLEEIKKKDGGFCTHSSILFLTWHRPYLALFESVLHDAMLFVANQFTPEEGRDKYLTAIKEFRMPFWDWARADLPVFPEEAVASSVARVNMPESLRKEYSELKRGTDGLVEIHNPLYSYKFQQGADAVFKIEGLQSTTRYQSAGVKTEQTADEQKQALIDSLTPYTREVNEELSVEGNLRERVVYLLQSYNVFDQVSHNQWDPTRKPRIVDGNPSTTEGLGFGSIEDIHNTLHDMVGGQGKDKLGRLRDGQMSHVPISAFDPIFWLHHTNIDRLLSLWEGLHSDITDTNAWVTTKVSTWGSWVTAPNTEEGNKTSLAPFYKDNDNFWTSDDVRETTTFGYAYPETKSWAFKNTNDYREDIKRQLGVLYSTGSLANMIAADETGDEKPEQILRSRAKRLARVTAVKEPSTALTALSIAKTRSSSELIASLPSLDVPNVQVPDGKSLANLVQDKTYLEWLVNIKAEKHSLDGAYQVHIFLGRVPQEEPTCLYAVSPYHVGTFSPLGQSADTGCDKCRREQAAGTEITGQIPLTIALAERYFAGELESLSEHDVIQYLQVNLHWEVIDGQGERLQEQRSSVDGLLVGVVSNKVTLPGSGQSAQYSPNVTVYPEITTKESGGFGRGEGTGVTEDNKYFSASYWV